MHSLRRRFGKHARTSFSRRFARLVGAVCLALLGMTSTGCIIPSIKQIRAELTHYAYFRVESDPDGAHVFSQGGTYYGVTPTEVKISSKGPWSGDYTIRLAKRGYRERTYTWKVACLNVSRPEAEKDAQWLMVILEPEPRRKTTDLAPVPIDQRLTLAVVDFDVGESMSADTGLAAADLCRHALAETQQYKLMDRNHMKDVLGEQDFAAAMHCDNAVCLVQYGKVLQAQRIVHGRLAKLGEEYTLHIGMTDVNTSELLSQVTTVVPSRIEELSDIIPDKVYELVTTYEGAKPGE